MEFRYLKYFVAVAETRHFTRAAEQLGIAQPPLSQQIKKLEHELGVDLFKRLSRGVELTHAGQVFYTDAVNILADVERAKAKARQIASGENTQVKIGFATSTSTCIKVLERIGRIQESGVHLQAAELSMPELAAQLKSKQLDLAIMRLPCYASEPFERKVLFNDPFVAAPPAGFTAPRRRSRNSRTPTSSTSPSITTATRSTSPACNGTSTASSATTRTSNCRRPRK